MDRALQRALFDSFMTAPAPAAASYSRPSGGHIRVTRTVTRPNGATSTTRHEASYGSRAAVSRSRASAGSFHSRAAPVVRGPSGRTFDSYRRETAARERRATTTSSSRRPDTNGRFNRLQRDGIMPTRPNAHRGGSSSTPTKPRKTKSTRRPPVPKRPLVVEEGEIFRPLGSGWVERTPDGEWVRSGLHTQMEADTREWYIVTYEPTSSSAQPGNAAVEEGMVNIELAIKSTRPTDPGPDSRSAFHIVLGYRSPQNFYMLVGDVQGKEWRVQHVDGTLVARVADTSMKANIFFNLVLLIRKDKLSVDANGTSVFESLKVGDESSLRGLVGVASSCSKQVFKNLRIAPAPGSKAASMVTKHSPRAAEASPVRTTARDIVRVRSGGAHSAGPRSAGVVTSGRRGRGGSSSTGRGAGSGRSHEFTQRGEDLEWLPEGKDRFVDDDPKLIEMIERNVLETNIGVTFDDIAELSDAKRLLNEAVVLPLLVPEFFTGIREPWKGVLLFGPPGTGKTMLAKAVAGMNGTTFFNVSAATLVSKWRGESEKLVQCLFRMARHYSPSILFVDEIDCLVTRRGSQSEHEASRRLKTQFLTQMDGITSKSSDSMVMVLATTNTPWDLDEALRRRLEKRIHIPLPQQAARLEMFKINLRDIPLAADVSFDRLAELTEGHSGADVHLVCREACMMGMRRLLIDKTPQDIQQLRNEGKLKSPPVSMNDLLAAVERTKPSVSVEDTDRYAEWEGRFGST